MELIWNELLINPIKVLSSVCYCINLGHNT